MVRIIINSSRLLDTKSMFRKQLYFSISAIKIAEWFFLMLTEESIKYLAVNLMKDEP